MIELERDEFYILPMFAHEGPVSLDAIATEFYGQKYKGQQTGEMISNDTYQVYDFSGEQLDWYADEYFDEQLERWQGLKIGDPNPSYHYPDGVIKYDFEIEREAPTPPNVLADLINKGHLPRGKYLVEVSW